MSRPVLHTSVLAAALALAVCAGCRSAEAPSAAAGDRAEACDRPAGEDRQAQVRSLAWDEMNALQKTGYVIVWPVGKIFEGISYGLAWAFFGYDADKVKAGEGEER